jgi:hypothetical protein
MGKIEEGDRLKVDTNEIVQHQEITAKSGVHRT